MRGDPLRSTYAVYGSQGRGQVIEFCLLAHNTAGGAEAALVKNTACPLDILYCLSGQFRFRHVCLAPTLYIIAGVEVWFTCTRTENVRTETRCL